MEIRSKITVFEADLKKLSAVYDLTSQWLYEYEESQMRFFLYFTAWICKIGLLDLIEKNDWQPESLFNIQNEEQDIQMSMEQLEELTFGRLKETVSKLCDSSVEEKVNEILAGGPAFFEIEASIPSKIRDIMNKQDSLHVQINIL